VAFRLIQPRIGAWTPLMALVAAALLSSCVPRALELPTPQTNRPGDFPEQTYQRAAAQGRPVFRIDPTSSLVAVEVRRAGSLARLGHDHVVASHDVQGYVEPDDGRADLYVPLDRLAVDEPDLRKEAGFDTEPTAEAIAGTRRNMLEKTLEADRFPFVSISVRGVDLGRAAARTAKLDSDVDVTITLHGVTRQERIPLQIEAGAEGIQVTGRVTLKQSDFGIVPLSILSGAIQVQDSVDLRFRIRTQALAH
jgi:hypothetical protein